MGLVANQTFNVDNLPVQSKPLLPFELASAHQECWRECKTLPKPLYSDRFLQNFQTIMKQGAINLTTELERCCFLLDAFCQRQDFSVR